MAIFYLLVTATTAGLNLIAIKYGLNDMSPVFLMLIRFGFSSIILAFLFKNKAKILERSKNKICAKFTKSDFIRLKKPLMISLYSSTAILFIVLGINQTTVSNTQVILAFVPIAVSVGAHYTSEEKHSLTKLISLFLGLSGTFALIFQHNVKTSFQAENILGNILIFISTILSAIYLIKSKKLSTKFSPLELAMTHSITTTILFFALALFTLVTEGFNSEIKFTVTSLGALTYLIIFGTIVNFYAYQKAIKLNSAFMVSLNSYVQIPVTILGGILLFGDKLSWNFIVGAILILAGSVLGTRNKLGVASTIASVD